MKKNVGKSFMVIGGLLIVGLIAVGAYVLRPPAEANAPIEAIPLATAPQESVSEEMPTQAPALDPIPTEAVGAYPAPTENVSAYPAPGEAVVTDGEAAYPAPTGSVTFVMVQAESEARFTLDEVLNGNPKTVVGTTDQVAGEIGVDFSNPANSQLGIIQINARTLTTDSTNRNRMIRNEILDTEPYEFITFAPTALTGLPATITVGETITFQITGDLTIRDVTKSVTFEATVTLVSADRLEGLTSVTVLRSDFGLEIPSVPSVANVTDEVLLEIEFVAVPK